MHAATIVCCPRPLRTRDAALGMTLIEICIAIAIAAALMMIAIPAVSSITRAQMRQRAGQLAGGLRSLYGASALRSASCRLVIDLDAGTYGSECAKGTIRLSGEREKSQNGHRELSKDEELLVDSKGRESMSDRDKAKLEILQKSLFAPTNDIPKTSLGKEVRFLSVWVEHQPERYTTGIAYLYYWPSGLAESASIQLGQGDDIISLIVSPLTGRVQIFNGEKHATGEKE